MKRELQTALCPNGAINVWSDDSSGDIHTVFVDRYGDVIRCTCKGHQHTGGCYHVQTIRASGQLRAAARAVMRAE